MKFGRFLLVAFALMLIAAPSFAAVSFTSASTLNIMAPNARTGLAGEVTLTVIAPSATAFAPQGETLINSFSGAQISTLATICVKVTAEGSVGGAQEVAGFGPTAACTAAGVPAGGIVNAAGVVTYGTTYTYALAAPSVSTIAVTINAKNITVAFPTGPVYFQNAIDGFRFTGVRLNVVPFTAGTATGGQLNATLTAILSQISTTNPILPIARMDDPIRLTGANVVTYSTGAILISPTNTATVYVTEEGTFSNSFETNGPTPGTDATEVIFNLSTIPTGVTVFAVAVGVPAATQIMVGSSANSVAGGVVVGAAAPTCGLPVNNATAGTATFTCYIPASDPSLLETLPVNITFAAAGSLPAGVTGYVTATLGPEVVPATLIVPNGDLVLAGTGLTFGTALGPVRYFRWDEPLVPVVTIVQLTTELLSVFNSYVPGTPGFDTGISINNASGYLGIVGQSDVITVTFQPYDGTVIAPITTSATFRPGLGLDANGKLQAGGSWIFLLSDLLSGAGVSGSFQGAIRFTCKFTNGHGVAFIGDTMFATQAQGYSMLVLGNDNFIPITSRPFALESVGN